MTFDDTLTWPISRMRISVVVCTHDRLESLRQALESLCQLNVGDDIDWEIVVVDNDSPTGVQPLVEDLAAKHSTLSIRYVLEPRRGIAHARQRGVDAAFGTWIAFFDDDQIADPAWLYELAKTAAARRAMCVGGQVKLILPKNPTRNLGPMCRDLLSETVGQPEPRRYDRRFKPGAGNLMIHRLAIERVGGFDLTAEGRGEDTILFLKILRAGYACWYTPRAIVHHVIPSSRLTDDSFDALIQYVSSRMPLFEKDHWRRMFPLAWSARVLQAALVHTPRYWVSHLSRDADRKLEARCRYMMAIGRICHGSNLLFATRTPLVSELPSSCGGP